MLEGILLAHAGYRVLMPNIRGSTGRGRPFVRALRGDWGGVDADDCHAVVDHAVDAGLADPERLGVFGLSYGGFLANWLVGTSDRFAAAVSENGVVNNVSAWAGSDCGPTYSQAAGIGDATTPEGVEDLWRQSPLRHVAAIRTPLLLLQGEADQRCPPGDAEQLFVALRALGREVDLRALPGVGARVPRHRPSRPADRPAHPRAGVVRPVDASLIVAREALIDEVDLAADGSFVVYGRRTTAGTANVRRLWTVPWSGGRPRPLTSGRHLDHSARISPDGAEVAFLSDRETGADQVWLVPVAGGEPRRLTSFKRGATALAWSPDGRSLAVCAHDDASPLNVGERASGEPTARVIQHLDWRDDDTYGLLLWPVHVHRVPLRGRARRLTSGRWFASSPGFLPDGRVGVPGRPAPRRRPRAAAAAARRLRAGRRSGAGLGRSPGPCSAGPWPATRSCCLAHGVPVPPTPTRRWSCACPTAPSSAATATRSPSTSRARRTSSTGTRARSWPGRRPHAGDVRRGSTRSPPPAARRRRAIESPAPATSTRSSRTGARGG